MDLLLEEGVVSQQPRALLTGPQGPAPRLARIQAQLQFARDRDPAAYSTRMEEFAYLANTLMAGGSIQARPFTSREASDAAAAVCNLGLENWPARCRTEKGSTRASAANGRTALPDDFLITHDLVGMFQVGWAVLYSDVSMYAAQQLLELLSALRIADRDVQAGLETLRLEMSRHWRAGAPWSARDALDVIMILDQPAWAALVGLIDQCPVIHAAIDASRRSGARAVSASAFEFISENSQIASVREFLQRLPEILRG
jgi:hypothetical protein